MWMLMEGVVLYVALVKVFIKHHKRYIAAFTVASYGQFNNRKNLINIPLTNRYSISIHGSSCSSWLLGQH